MDIQRNVKNKSETADTERIGFKSKHIAACSGSASDHPPNYNNYCYRSHIYKPIRTYIKLYARCSDGCR